MSARPNWRRLRAKHGPADTLVIDDSHRIELVKSRGRWLLRDERHALVGPLTGYRTAKLARLAAEKFAAS